MTDIFPVRIWKIWGSSSREVFRRIRPTRVIYCSGFSSRWVGTSWGLDIFMVRNFMIRKWVLCRPTRFWKKNAGPGSSILIARAMRRYKGESITIPQKDKRISKARFPNLRYKSVPSFCRFFTQIHTIVYHRKGPTARKSLILRGSVRRGSNYLIFSSCSRMSASISPRFFSISFARASWQRVRTRLWPS